MKPLFITLSLLITAALFAEDRDIVERKYAPKLKAAKKVYDEEVTSIRKRMYKAYLSLRDRAMRDKDLGSANEWNKKADALKSEGLENAGDGLTESQLIGKSFHWYGTAAQWNNPGKNTIIFNAGGKVVSPWNLSWKIEGGKLGISADGAKKVHGYFYCLGNVGGSLTLVCPNWANSGIPHTLKEIASPKK